MDVSFHSKVRPQSLAATCLTLDRFQVSARRPEPSLNKAFSLQIHMDLRQVPDRAVRGWPLDIRNGSQLLMRDKQISPGWPMPGHLLERSVNSVLFFHEQDANILK